VGRVVAVGPQATTSAMMIDATDTKNGVESGKPARCDFCLDTTLERLFSIMDPFTVASCQSIALLILRLEIWYPRLL
jgi:hypothetical protein